jgi:hypothetical protein
MVSLRGCMGVLIIQKYNKTKSRYLLILFVHKKAKGLERITIARVIYAGGRLTLVLIVITLFRNCKFQ